MTSRFNLRRLARKVARNSVGRTAYSSRYSLSFTSDHAERLSLCLLCEAGVASFALAWQPCLHVSRAREQGSRTREQRTRRRSADLDDERF